MIPIILNIITILTILFLMLITIKNCKNHKKNNNVLFLFLSKNIELLTTHEHRYDMYNFKKTLKLMSYCKELVVDSKCDYLSLFKYDYTKGYVKLNFLFTMKSDYYLIDNSLLDNLPVTSSLMTKNVFRSNNDDLYSFSVDDIKESCVDIYDAFKIKDIHKMYYKNLYRNNDETSEKIGFLILSYKDENVLSQEEKTNILNIIQKVKKHL